MTALGRIALAFCVIATCTWTLRGVILNFHEGWWQPVFLDRLCGLALTMMPAIVCMAFTALALGRPLIGGWILILSGLIYGALAANQMHVAASISKSAGVHSAPLTVSAIFVGILFLWEYRRQSKKAPEPVEAGFFRRHSRWLMAVGLPAVCLLIDGIPLLVQVEQRFSDGIQDERVIEGNGVVLTWAPAGPGWQRFSDKVRSWNDIARYGRLEVQDTEIPWTDGMADATPEVMNMNALCTYLSADGRMLMSTPQNIWRLPTVEELVLSLVRDGANAGGTWDPAKGKALYTINPDKESPLWDIHAPVIAFWTSSEDGPHNAWIVFYNGQVRSIHKRIRRANIGFRCVKSGFTQ